MATKYDKDYCVITFERQPDNSITSKVDCRGLQIHETLGMIEMIKQTIINLSTRDEQTIEAKNIPKYK